MYQYIYYNKLASAYVSNTTVWRSAVELSSQENSVRHALAFRMIQIILIFILAIIVMYNEVIVIHS